ncbi:MAG: cation tolerance protein [Rickettsia sp.]
MEKSKESIRRGAERILKIREHHSTYRTTQLIFQIKRVYSI